ncbi:nicotinamide mononucleotide transporter [Draconibacterium orientale]|jgi:nicotinamide mononucleotide transporter|uniref:Nicotinamide riboside transporter PnuC n=1 Tax=Draconibacterium orientale TaxID=1168034 RepID=X5E049_9BACT|nr:nicotinamide riboside transporter PnuC [Draconibacterium orientale]AHW60850.1 membrane protein [Draconibacterium orientale]SES66944.1 nicotinamide mononucleotide transporter [Draconibacterium orientale]
MTDIVLEWLLGNYIEILGAILGLVYIFFSIKQHILTWPTGLLTSALYVFVFFNARLYADMGLQAYYVVISIYGWYFWLTGKKQNEKKVAVKTTRKALWMKLTVVSIALYALLFFILSNYTNSDVPHMDSVTTALSIVATWMLARKYIEHWLLWIFIDAFSAGLYVYKGLWATVILFIVYTVMALLGYIEWRKDLKNIEAKN